MAGFDHHRRLHVQAGDDVPSYLQTPHRKNPAYQNQRIGVP